MRLFFIGLTILGIRFTGFSQEIKGPNLIEKDHISSIVKQTLINYQNEVNARGLLAEFKYLDSSEDFFWAPPGYSSAIKYDSVAKIIRLNQSKIKSINNHFENLKIVVLSKRLVSYNTLIHSKTNYINGNSEEYDLIETGVLIKRESGWKLINGQTSLLCK